MSKATKEKSQQSKSGFLQSLFLSAFLAVLGIGVGVYAMGWLEVESDSDATSIELKTGEIEESVNEAVNDAVETKDELLEGAGELLHDAGNAFTDESSETSAEPEEAEN